MLNEKEFLQSIKQIDYPEEKYIKKEYTKTQIVLHHTVSNGSALDVSNYWKTLPTRVGTCMILERDGTLNQLFSSKYYAGHLGLKPDHFIEYGIPYTDLNKSSIGIEMISWGGLKEKNGRLYNAYGKEVVNETVTKLSTPYRGYTYYHSYTGKQIETLKNILLYWGERYSIPLDYNANMWDISEDALEGTPGIWSHTSVRKDKSDAFIQPELISMLKSLKGGEKL
ncbi:MAG: N-acetylmuramoyl-L-alanine amidase [Candidatus Omnitrophica bacterium]|jgi:N-acetyl-anhydromuramyl-L-alanine amidase AmpD|nr:N-acetylmuramoyl-L-alanine amidase [Candidatus Omnitrophota bacterium]